MNAKKLLILLSTITCLLLFSACADSDPAPYTISPEEIVAVKFGSKYPVVTDSRIKEPFAIGWFFDKLTENAPKMEEVLYTGEPSMENIDADTVVLMERTEGKSNLYLFLYKNGAFIIIDKDSAVMLSAEEGSTNYQEVVFFENYAYPVYNKEINSGAWIRLTNDGEILLTDDGQPVFAISIDDIYDFRFCYHYLYPSTGAGIEDPFVIEDFFEDFFTSEYRLTKMPRDFQSVKEFFDGKDVEIKANIGDGDDSNAHICIYMYSNGDFLIFNAEEGDYFYFAEGAGLDYDKLAFYRNYSMHGQTANTGFRD